jgi:hypothetical protein
LDASSISLGAILSHPCEGDIDHPITFGRRKLSTMEKNYTTIEREGLAMVYALHGSHFKMYVDHSMLRYMVNKIVLGARL